MSELSAALKVLLANHTFMYYKIASYHWNVEGLEFSQFHDFYGDLYADVYGAIDDIAENIRKVDDYAPISLSELYNYKTIDENTTKIDLIRDQLATIIVDNDKVIESLNKVFSIANAKNEQGLADYVAGRLDTHKKHAWMLKASAKNVG